MYKNVHYVYLAVQRNGTVIFTELSSRFNLPRHCIKTSIIRLNSGIKNRYNFFIHAIFLFPIIGTDSVHDAESGDSKSILWELGFEIFAEIFKLRG